jgi:hypothetical protein
METPDVPTPRSLYCSSPPTTLPQATTGLLTDIEMSLNFLEFYVNVTKPYILFWEGS